MHLQATHTSCTHAHIRHSRTHHALAGNADTQNRESYEDVIRRPKKLFWRIRYSVAQQSAPTTLKSAFLDPLKTRLSLEVALDMFARTDADFMSMFTGACACWVLWVLLGR